METPLVSGDESLASALEGAGVLEEYLPDGASLITQGAWDSDLFIILAGEVEIRLNGRVIAHRKPREHVGEMAMIEPGGARSATVRAVVPTVVLRLMESEFVPIGDRHPQVWRRLACELVNRLRQRSSHYKPQNDRPYLFIASSVEGLPVANAIQVGLAHSGFVVQVWTNDVFRASSTAIEDLLRVASQSDFGLAVLGPDDLTESRREVNPAPRDNCVFELGIFMGAMGRDRSLFLVPRGVDLKIPSDLVGVKPLDYEPDDAAGALAVRLGPAVTQLQDHINRNGVR